MTGSRQLPPTEYVIVTRGDGTFHVEGERLISLERFATPAAAMDWVSALPGHRDRTVTLRWREEQAR